MKSLIYTTDCKAGGMSADPTVRWHLRVYLVAQNKPSFLCDVYHIAKPGAHNHHEAIREHMNKNNRTIEFDGIYAVP